MLKRKKIKAFLCFLLAVSVVFAPSVNISAQGFLFGNQGFFEEQSTNVKLRYMFGIFYDGKPLQGGKAHIILDLSIFNMIFMFDFFPEADITILGEYKDTYYYVSYNGTRGYIPKFFISGNIDYKYILLNKRHLVVYQQENKSVKISEKNVSGTADWKISDTSIAGITKDGEKCTVKGKKTGVATVTASMGGVTEKCYVCVVDKWKYGWKTQTVAEAQLYNFPAKPKEAVATLPKGTTVTVYGDCQSANKYCYVKYNNGSKDVWGFVHIRYLFNKGKYMDEYTAFDWEYPLDKKYIHLSSYYGQRDRTDVPKHMGIDVFHEDMENFTSIEDAVELKAVADGKIEYVNTELTTKKAQGYCVAIKTNDIDPITGKNLIVIYMHLLEKPNFQVGQIIEKGKPIGKVGNTPNVPYHMHLEITNHGDVWGNRSFKNSVNALLFYPDIKFTTDQVSSWYGMYWSGDTKDTKVSIN